jgi:hypothetical protein
MTVRESALELVPAHREAEPNLLRVVFYPDPHERVVRLLEVIEGSPHAGEALPCRFARDESGVVPYPVIVVELSPAEFEQLEEGKLALPEGWVQEAREVLYPSA